MISVDSLMAMPLQPVMKDHGPLQDVHILNVRHRHRRKARLFLAVIPQKPPISIKVHKESEDYSLTSCEQLLMARGGR
jgi:hypothetical protein